MGGNLAGITHLLKPHLVFAIGDRSEGEFAEFDPPLREPTTRNFKVGSTLPIKFHLAKSDGSFVSQERRVSVIVSGPLGATSTTRQIFEQANGTLKFDSTESPPHYVANLSTKNFAPGEYKVEVRKYGVIIGATVFFMRTK